MNKSKRRNKIIKKQPKNKTIKNKSGLEKCEKFCKNDYMVETEKNRKMNMDKYFNGYKPSSKETQDVVYNTCKKRFCNENCEGILNDKQKQLEYKKMINNGFHKSYSKDKIEKFKSRGAMSGCVPVTDYDVYHK
jgi:hypothetical protein